MSTTAQHMSCKEKSHTTSKKSKKRNKLQLHDGIISSPLNQSSNLFQSPGQGLQCVANCVISIIYHKHKNCINWNINDIRNILFSGNILYNSIGKFTTLLVSDVPRYIKLYSIIYNIQEINSIIGNISCNNSLANLIPFDKNETIITKYKYLVLVLGSSALSIIYFNNVFYTFDPHRRNINGLPDSNGGSVILKFNSFNLLCTYVKELSHSLCASSYELTPIKITKYTQKITEMNDHKQTQDIEQHKNELVYDTITENVVNNTNNVQSINHMHITTDLERHCVQTETVHKCHKTQYSPNETVTLANLENPLNNPKNVKDISENNNFCQSNCKTENDDGDETMMISTRNNQREDTQEKDRNMNEKNLTYNKCNINIRKRKINDNKENYYNTKKIKIENISEIFPSKKQITTKQIPLSDMIILRNEIKNKQTNVILCNSYLLCKKYGYNFKKSCYIKLNDITQTLAILNAKIQLQTKKNVEIIYRKEQKNNVTTNMPDERQRKLTQFHKTLEKAFELNRTAYQYGYTFNKIPIVQILNSTSLNQLTTNKQINKKLTKNDRQQYGKSLDESIQIFNKLTSEGPIYICSVCQQMNFKDKVQLIKKLRINKYTNLLNDCKTNYMSINNDEYICNTCKYYIFKGIIPKISVKNGCSFVFKPDALNLFNLEERYVSPVMAFMLIHQLFPGRQLSLFGSICHLPIEIGKMIHTLPRNFDQHETISVNLKRRLCYKNTVFSENIRPHKILEALKYLIDTSDLYKENNINLNTDWLDEFTNYSDSITNITHTNSNITDTNTNNEEITDSSDDEIIEDSQPNAPSINTLLTDKTIDPDKNIISIAPGEGQKPIFTDPDTEYLCFPYNFLW